MITPTPLNIQIYFAVIGITGEGKSLFVNTISGQNKFAVSSSGDSETQKVQDVEFIFNNGSLVAIDTPGLDNSLYNYEKIQNLKTLIIYYPTIKCILIVKNIIILGCHKVYKML